MPYIDYDLWFPWWEDENGSCNFDEEILEYLIK